MILADFGVAFVIVLGLAFFGAFAARSAYRRRHPPPTLEEQTAWLEQELADISRVIEESRTCCPTLPNGAHTGLCKNSLMRSGEERWFVNE
jgi:hypothetical protein